MRILVVGGTGTAGRPLVTELVRRGHDVRVLTRRGDAGVDGARGLRGDVSSGAGLAEGVDGADVVVDCLNVETLSRKRATAFFEETTRRLHRAATTAGVRHHVLLSIVGIEDIPFPYYEAKLVQEHAVTGGPIPWSVLRTTPFHEFVPTMARRGRAGPFVIVPRQRTAPVAAAEVGVALADIAERDPAGRVPDLGGPRTEEAVDLVRRWMRARAVRGVVVPLSPPGRAGRAMRDGTQVPRNGRRGTRTFDEWLAAQR